MKHVRSTGREAVFGTLILLPEASEKATSVELDTQKGTRNRLSSGIRFFFSGARVNSKI